MTELVIFDVDNTILRGQSQQALLKYLYSKGYFTLGTYVKLGIWFLLYKLNLVKNPRSALNRALRCLKGKNVEEMDSLMDSFFREMLAGRVFPKAQEEIDQHRKNDRLVLLLSNAVEPLVKRIAKHVNADYYLGTKLEVKESAYTGSIDGDIVYGELKVVAIKNFLTSVGMDPKKTWGYGDHATDAHFLETTDYPHAVHADRKLKKIAKNKGWKIKNFKT